MNCEDRFKFFFNLCARILQAFLKPGENVTVRCTRRLYKILRYLYLSSDVNLNDRLKDV